VIFAQIHEIKHLQNVKISKTSTPLHLP